MKKLKAQLSSYLRQVRMGETVLVTDRDEVVAELVPPRASGSALSAEPVELALDRLADEGALVRARSSERVKPWAPVSLGRPAGTAQGLLDELRSDR